MNYTEIIEYIYKSFPMYHRIGTAAYKEGLENIERLAEMAGHPEQKLKAIHIAGTNGKGSVAHLLSSYFQELGLKTGLFTSPHLIDFRERIKVNGKDISEQQVINFFDKYKTQMAEIEPSFFEMTTILAFDTFVNENVDIAIIEVGLGGRLDATNILSPILSVITNISLDHTKMLGNTLVEIAHEKAGIIKDNTPVVIGEYHPDTYPVFEKIAQQKNAPLFLAEEYRGDLEFGGAYQRKNIGTFAKCVGVMQKDVNIFNRKVRKESAMDAKSIASDFSSLRSLRKPFAPFAVKNSVKSAIKNLQTNTGFSGRWQILTHSPLTICDVAHNPAGITLVMEQLQQLPYNNLHIIIGFANDKEIDEIIPLLPKHALYYACQANIERAMPAEKLYQKLSTANLNVQKVSRVTKAYQQVQSKVQANDVIFIGGSFFVVGEFLHQIQSHQHHIIHNS